MTDWSQVPGQTGSVCPRSRTFVTWGSCHSLRVVGSSGYTGSWGCIGSMIGSSGWAVGRPNFSQLVLVPGQAGYPLWVQLFPVVSLDRCWGLFLAVTVKRIGKNWEMCLVTGRDWDGGWVGIPRQLIPLPRALFPSLIAFFFPHQTRLSQTQTLSP